MNFVIENNILKGVEVPIDADLKLGQLIYDALSESPDHVAQVCLIQRTQVKQVRVPSVPWSETDGKLLYYIILLLRYYIIIFDEIES